MKPDAFNHNKPNFDPPEGYIDTFEQSLMERIRQKEERSAFSIYRSWQTIMAAACIGAILMAAGWNLQRIMWITRTNSFGTPQSATLQIPDAETGLLNDEDLLEWIDQPLQLPVNMQLHNDNEHSESVQPAGQLLSTEDLIEAGLIEPEDPALNLEGIF
jgi:hypothetical protein